VDRIDKVLLVMPFLPFADLLSTLFSLGFGGEEVGILARPVLEHYGSSGLVVLALSASVTFFVFMKIVIYIRKLLAAELRFRWVRYVLAVPVYWFFVLEAVYVSTVVMNFLVPLAPLLTQTFALRAALVFVYLAFVSMLTMAQMRRLPRF